MVSVRAVENRVAKGEQSAQPSCIHCGGSSTLLGDGTIYCCAQAELEAYRAALSELDEMLCQELMNPMLGRDIGMLKYMRQRLKTVRGPR